MIIDGRKRLLIGNLHFIRKTEKKLEMAHDGVPHFGASKRCVTSQFRREKIVGLINKGVDFSRKIDQTLEMSLKVVVIGGSHPFPRTCDRKVLYHFCWIFICSLVKSVGVFYRAQRVTIRPISLTNRALPLMNRNSLKFTPQL